MLCYERLGFKATPRIKKWPLVPDQVPYHPNTQYPVVWICGELISSEVSEIDHPQIVGEREKLFQKRGERKVARHRVVNKMTTKKRTSAFFLAFSG